MQNTAPDSPEQTSDAEGYHTFSSVVETFTVPSFLPWTELALFGLVVLLAAVLFFRRMSWQSFCLLAGTAILAACQAHSLLPLIFAGSEMVYRFVLATTQAVLWLGLLGPLFLAVYVLRLLRDVGATHCDAPRPPDWNTPS